MLKYFPLLIILTFVLFAGCGEKSPYDTVFVSGTVLVDGAPMDGISVTFSPVNSSAGHAAGGVTDAQGHFTVTTAGLKIGSGAVSGQYDVLFAKMETEGSDLTYEEAMVKFKNRNAETIYHVPQKYGSPQTSGIAPVTVEKGKKNEFNFELSTANSKTKK